MLSFKWVTDEANFSHFGDSLSEAKMSHLSEQVKEAKKWPTREAVAWMKVIVELEKMKEKWRI